MNTNLIQRMQTQFDELAQTHPEEIGLEFWFARDLQEPLGYARWENFLTAIRRAIESCKSTGYEAEHHFRGVTKLITLGKGKVWNQSHQAAGGPSAHPDYRGKEPRHRNDQSQRAGIRSV